MSFATDLRADLLAITEVSTNLGDNIAPVIAKEHTLPIMAYQVGGGVRETTFKSSFGKRERSVRLDYYTTNYADVDTVKEAIIERYNGFAGVINASGDDGGSSVGFARVDNIIETKDSVDDDVFRCIIEITFID